MLRLPHFCFISAAAYAFVGMALGIFMAASHNHTLSPAHAHLNLLGWVSMALFGLFYQAAPHIAATRRAKFHVALSTVSVWLLIPGVALANLGINEGLAIAGSLAAILSMALFVYIVAGARKATPA